MKRRADSHKGDHGVVAIIGGSRTMHGAPIFSALAAEASGADLVYLALPSCHAPVARSHSLNFQVHPFHGDDLAAEDRSMILELLATMDCAVIGPGLARTPATLKTLEDIITEAPCRLILDATALQPWTLTAVAGKRAILTPHLGELERMGLKAKDIGRAAKNYGATIALKSEVVTVASTKGTTKQVRGGNAGLTVGGTGDALAGLIAGLVAQGMPPEDAGETAARVIKRAATVLYPDYGYAFGTRRVIEQIPRLLTHDA